MTETLKQVFLAPRRITTIFAQYTMLRKFVLVLTGVLIFSTSAQLEIPLTPVPVTLQTFAVLLFAMLTGKNIAVTSAFSYLICGLIGLPVFFGFSGGLAHLLGPTGGYLTAFPFAAALVGYMADKGWNQHILLALSTAIVGQALILLIGMSYLSIFVGMKHAFRLGVTPFIVGELCKAIMVAVIAYQVKRGR